MRLKVLGCSGGIGGSLRTTSFLLDSDVLIDAGTGVGDLSLSEMSSIDHVFLTHAHLDHIASLPLMLDSVTPFRDQPLLVYATRETIATLREHVFNWKVWPDFSQIPDAETPYLRFVEIEVGQTLELDAGRRITPLSAEHTVPAVGYWLDSGKGGLVFTGDTSSNDALWRSVNAIDNLRYLIIETAFSNAEREVADLSRHLYPEKLAQELEKLERDVEIHVTHLKPGEADLIMREIDQCVQRYRPAMLQNGRTFEF